MVCEKVRLAHGFGLDNRRMKQLSVDLGKTIGLGEEWQNFIIDISSRCY